MMCAVKLRRLRSFALLALAAAVSCIRPPAPPASPASAGKAPTAAVTPPTATPAVPVDDERDTHHMASELRSRLPAIERCYDDQLAANPGLVGKLVMRWTIEPSGATTDVAVDSETMPEPAVGACIVELVKVWRFQAFSGDSVKVSVPFVFGIPPDQPSPPVHP
jgi:hypothetical protein